MTEATQTTEQPPRSRWDYIFFALTFLGFVMGVAGMVVNSILSALIGVAFMGVGLLYFLFNSRD